MLPHQSAVKHVKKQWKSEQTSDNGLIEESNRPKETNRGNVQSYDPLEKDYRNQAITEDRMEKRRNLETHLHPRRIQDRMDIPNWESEEDIQRREEIYRAIQKIRNTPKERNEHPPGKQTQVDNPLEMNKTFEDFESVPIS